MPRQTLLTLDTVDNKGLNYLDCEVLGRINTRSSDIAGGAQVGKDEIDVCSHLSDESEDANILQHSITTCLRDVRKKGDLWWLRTQRESSTGFRLFFLTPKGYSCACRLRAALRTRETEG